MAYAVVIPAPHLPLSSPCWWAESCIKLKNLTLNMFHHTKIFPVVPTTLNVNIQSCNKGLICALPRTSHPPSLSPLPNPFSCFLNVPGTLAPGLFPLPTMVLLQAAAWLILSFFSIATSMKYSNSYYFVLLFSTVLIIPWQILSVVSPPLSISCLTKDNLWETYFMLFPLYCIFMLKTMSGTYQFNK